MIGRISGINSYYAVQHYSPVYQRRAVHAPQTQEMPKENVTAPKSPVPAVGQSGRNEVPDLFIRKGADPAEYAVRMRMQYLDADYENSSESETAKKGEGIQKTAGEGECQTCKKRKYQDGSNDMGVSFKTPTRVAPESAAAAVRGHEQEHVVRERAKAQRENRRVISQSVTLHTSICPECGRAYISGGTTQTTTAAKPEPQNNAGQEQASSGRLPFSAVA